MSAVTAPTRAGMHARARAVFTEDGTFRELHSQPPLTLRRVFGEEPGTGSLCLIGSAAGPLDGDDLGLQLVVEAGARASVTASGASLASGNHRDRARLSVDLELADGAMLRGDLGPLIVAAGAVLDVALRVRLATDATLTWRELVVLGRHDEPSGSLRLHWDVERSGRAVLRQSTDLSQQSLRDWPGMVGSQRVLLSVLRVGPDVAAQTRVLSRHVAVHRLDEHAELITVLAGDAVTARRELARLQDRVDDGPGARQSFRSDRVESTY